jgi:RNA polymerase sigma-70 factor (ECF subfamily)
MKRLMKPLVLAPGPGALPSSQSADGGSDAAEKRLRWLVDTHHDFVWRSLRRLGVAPADVDDAAQHVFVTASRKLATIRAGAERSFLFQTALRVAADSRKKQRRNRELDAIDGEQPPVDAAPTGEDLLDLRRARERLDRILDAMSLELRAVFVLFELDQLTMAEIAELLELPAGTVASRLRRARVEFRERVEADRQASPDAARRAPRKDEKRGGT